MKHVGVLAICKILYAFVGMDNKTYKMHGMYIKIIKDFFGYKYKPNIKTYSFQFN